MERYLIYLHTKQNSPLPGTGSVWLNKRTVNNPDAPPQQLLQGAGQCPGLTLG